MAKEKKMFNYQEAIDKIEAIINEIENGDPNVDELTKMVNQAFVLINQCKLKLRASEDILNAGFDQSETGN